MIPCNLLYDIMYSTYIYILLLEYVYTGMYYLRTKPAAKAIQFTVDKSYERREKQQRNSLGDKTIKPTSGSSGSSGIEKGHNSEGSVSDEDDDDEGGAGGGDEVYGEACISCSG